VKPLGEDGGENLVEGGEMKSQSQARVWVGTVKACLVAEVHLIERRLAYFLCLDRRI
jgi:hypothetical protein